MKYLSLLSLLFIFSCSQMEIKTVSELDLNKYSGLWYEIERFPNSFEKGLKSVTAEYQLMDNGKIKVINSGFNTEKNKRKETVGKAYVPNKSKPGEIKVTFFWPFYGDYNVLFLDEEYKYALVGSKSRKYAWILSREIKVNEDIINKIKDVASEQGFDISNFKRIEHDCN